MTLAPNEHSFAFLLAKNTPAGGSRPCRFLRKTTLLAAIFLLTLSCQLPTASNAQTIRVAQFNTALGRKGPGLLLKAILSGEDMQVAGIAGIIAQTNPDILLLNEFDYDTDLVALTAFADLLRKQGLDYPHLFALPVNSGVPSKIDLNGDGKDTYDDDAFGYGRFSGHNGMAILSRFEIDTPNARSFASLRWQDVPDARLPLNPDGSKFLSEEALQIYRLSSKSHWDVPITINGQVLHLLASHPTPPVFDGPEDLNGWRNSDEILFWTHYLNGEPFTDDQGRSQPFDNTPFVVLGTLNADPSDGDGHRSAIAALLSHPALQDPKPASIGAAEASNNQTGHTGDPSLDTTYWNDPDGPGNLRVDFVLPSSGLIVSSAGVFWPPEGSLQAELLKYDDGYISDHRLVWIDLDL